MPDVSFKPHDAAILLKHLVTCEQFRIQCLWKDEWHAAQKGYGRRTRRKFPHRNPSVQKPQCQNSCKIEQHPADTRARAYFIKGPESRYLVIGVEWLFLKFRIVNSTNLRKFGVYRRNSTEILRNHVYILGKISIYASVEQNLGRIIRSSLHGRISLITDQDHRSRSKFSQGSYGKPCVCN